MRWKSDSHGNELVSDFLPACFQLVVGVHDDAKRYSARNERFVPNALNDFLDTALRIHTKVNCISGTLIEVADDMFVVSVFDKQQLCIVWFG